MKNINSSPLPDVSDIIQGSRIYTDRKESQKDFFTNTDIFDNSIDLDEFEEAFADHILMSKRLRRTLYSGDFNGFENLPDHPPIALTGLALELFSKAAPNYGLDVLDMDYVSAVSEAVKVSPCAMIVAMIYLERLRLKNSDYLDTVSPSGLFVVTMLIASKFLFEDEDDCVTNHMWSEILNYEVKELNSLEQQFLSAIEWKVYVDSSEYLEYLCQIEKQIVIKQFLKNNWLNYSDMSVMMQDPTFQAFCKFSLKKILKAVLLWTIGYIASACVVYVTSSTIQKYKMAKYGSQELKPVSVNIQDLPISSYNAFKNFQISNSVSLDVHRKESDFSENDLSFQLVTEAISYAGYNYLICRNFYKCGIEKRILSYDLRQKEEIIEDVNILDRGLSSKILVLINNFFKDNSTLHEFKKPTCTSLLKI